MASPRFVDKWDEKKKKKKHPGAKLFVTAAFKQSLYTKQTE